MFFWKASFKQDPLYTFYYWTLKVALDDSQFIIIHLNLILGPDAAHHFIHSSKLWFLAINHVPEMTILGISIAKIK